MNSSGTVNRHTPRKVCFGAVSFRIDKISPTANGLTDEKSERSKIEEGKTADYLFDWNLDTIWSEGDRASQIYAKTGWDEFVMDNLHLIVFVSTKAADEKGNEFYYVNNVIDCPINGQTPFEYR